MVNFTNIDGFEDTPNVVLTNKTAGDETTSTNRAERGMASQPWWVSIVPTCCNPLISRIIMDTIMDTLSI